MPSRISKWLTEGLKKVGLVCLLLLLCWYLPESGNSKTQKRQTGKVRKSLGSTPKIQQKQVIQSAKALLAPLWLIPGAGTFVGDQSGIGTTRPRFKLSLVQCSGVLSRAADDQWQLTDVANNWKLQRIRGGITDRSISGKDLVPSKLTEAAFPTGSFQSLIAAGDSQTQTNDDAARLLNERMKLAVTQMREAIQYAVPSDNKAFTHNNGVTPSSATLPPDISESLPTRHTFTVRDGQIHWVAEMSAG